MGVRLPLYPYIERALWPMFVISIILWVLAVILLAGGLIARNGWVVAGAVLSAAVGFLFLFFSTYYTVEPGEAKVLKQWDSVIIGSEAANGPHWKDPWVDAIDFDVRNQLAVFLGNGEQTYNGSPTNGPQITFTDKDGVTANLDIVVLYSINPAKVEELVAQYTNQDDFRTKVIEQDIRSVPRDIPGKYTTIQMMTDRVTVASQIKSALETEWKDKGIQIEDVSLQEIRYPKEVQERFLAAQNAQTAVIEASAAAEKAKIDADSSAYVTKTEAQAEADANNLLAKSLTPQVLQSRWIEAISKAKTIVVPQDFTALGNLNTGAAE